MSRLVEDALGFFLERFEALNKALFLGFFILPLGYFVDELSQVERVKTVVELFELETVVGQHSQKRRQSGLGE